MQHFMFNSRQQQHNIEYVNNYLTFCNIQLQIISKTRIPTDYSINTLFTAELTLETIQLADKNTKICDNKYDLGDMLFGKVNEIKKNECFNLWKARLMGDPSSL